MVYMESAVVKVTLWNNNARHGVSVCLRIPEILESTTLIGPELANADVLNSVLIVTTHPHCAKCVDNSVKWREPARSSLMSLSDRTEHSSWVPSSKVFNGRFNIPNVRSR